MKQRVTLRDIADAAKVHYSTVSLALRNSPRLSPDVRKRVKDIAEKMGYVPDPMLSALNAYRKTTGSVHYQATLAWINNWINPKELRSIDTFNDYFLGASQRARQMGYEIEEFALHDPGMNPDRLMSILRSRNIQGLLLPPQPLPRTGIDFDFSRFATVAFGYSFYPQILHAVTNHQMHSMMLSLENLYRVGYRRIGVFLDGFIDEKADHNYSMAYWLFNRKQHLRSVVPPLIQSKRSDAELSRWINKYHPDVIVTHFLDLPKKLREMGIQVPQDIGFAHLSVSRDNKTVSGIYENGTVIGMTAVDLLIGMLQRGELGVPEIPIRILVESVWNPGQTTRQLLPSK
jgi:LacI family transcriptional regulator